MKIDWFRVNKIYSTQDCQLEFEDNRLVLIGENGSSKTTMLRLLFYTLSSQWNKLLQYDFESIVVIIDSNEIMLKKSEIKRYVHIDIGAMKRLPSLVRREIVEIRESGNKANMSKLRHYCNRYGIPYEYVQEIINGELYEEENIFNTQSIRSTNDRIKTLRSITEHVHILYLPTYRRIEHDLEEVLKGRIEEREFQSMTLHDRFSDSKFTELVEFGMNDVSLAVSKMLNNLKDHFRDRLNALTLEYLRDVVETKYKELDVSEIADVKEDTVSSILQRVEENILPQSIKDNLLAKIKDVQSKKENISEHDKVVCHYFIKLLKAHRDLENEEVCIREFRDLCSEYLNNKIIKYNPSAFTFELYSNTEQKIDYNELSSGEKQIVSLFSYLYLSGSKEYFVLIDEPELSLSVTWQKRFLEDIINGTNCIGLFAVTHSPFVFDNSLEKYARSIKEFSLI